LAVVEDWSKEMSEYPSDKELVEIAGHKVDNDNFHTFMDYVRSTWWMPDWGWTRDGDTYRISTGGWSGNEDIIKALMDNFMFWLMYWKQSKVGGHYIFSVSKDWDETATLAASRSAWMKMAEELEVYGDHRYLCNTGKPHEKCNCGLDELITKLQAMKAEEK
jgi:hypothetical protein